MSIPADPSSTKGEHGPTSASLVRWIHWGWRGLTWVPLLGWHALLGLRGRRRAQAWVVAVLLLGLAGYCRWAVTASVNDPGVDGGYYASVALQVREGNGLKTNVSILHKGDTAFPAPSSIYPLWPLVWGYAARVLPMSLVDVGLFLSGLSYVVALLFCYLWGAQLYPRPLLPRLLPFVNVGHLFLAVLAISVLFVSTSQPYTEGLAYGLMFAAFWRFTPLLRRPSWRSGLEMGLWLGLILLARPQLAVTTLAAASVLGFAVLFVRPRVRYAVMFACCAAAFTASVAPWLLYVWSFSPDSTLIDILKFATVRSSDALSPLASFPHDRAKNFCEVIADRLWGFVAAFEWHGRHSYEKRYFKLHYAIPAAAVFALLGLVKLAVTHRLGKALRWLSDRRNLPHLYAFAYGLGAFLALHAIHTNSGWYFRRRHALAAVVWVSLSLGYLFLFRGHLGRLARVVGLVILVAGVLPGAGRLVRAAEVGERRHGRQFRPPRIVRWIDRQQRKTPNLVIADRQPQRYAYLLPKVGFHYYGLRTSQRDLEAMVTRLGARYVLVPSRRRRWFSSRGRNFKVVRRYADRYIYAPKPSLRQGKGKGKAAIQRKSRKSRAVRKRRRRVRRRR